MFNNMKLLVTGGAGFTPTPPELNLKIKNYLYE